MSARKIDVDWDFQGNSILNATYPAASIANTALITNPLARANHTGTQTASTISDFVATAVALTHDQFAAPVANVSWNSKKITSLANGTATQDAATYGQLLSMVNGTKWLAPCLVATTANITLSGEQTIDGITTSASRVLVKNQSTASQNGAYLSAAGSWTRTTDLPTGNSAASVSCFIEEGTTLADTQWICTTDPGSDTVGTNSLVFAQFGSATSYTADESSLHLSGTTFSIKSTWVGQTAITTLGTIGTGTWQGTAVGTSYGGTGGTTAATGLANLGGVGKYSTNFGDGSALSYTITHNLGTTDVHVQIQKVSDATYQECAIVAASTNTVTVALNTAPASNALRCIVHG